jgi:hypothetical protein
MSERLTENELHQTMDAQIWASEFVALHGGDESLMLGWFANAIMVGFDEGQRRLKPTQQQVVDIKSKWKLAQSKYTQWKRTALCCETALKLANDRNERQTNRIRILERALQIAERVTGRERTKCPYEDDNEERCVDCRPLQCPSLVPFVMKQARDELAKEKA